MTHALRPEHPVLCLVLDADAAADADRLRALVAAGVDWVQVRDRRLEADALLRLVDAVVASARGARAGARVLVNRRSDVAWAAGADGVHLGFDAVSPVEARALLGPGALLGASLHDPAELDAPQLAPSGVEPSGVERAAVDERQRSLDYAHLAPIFPPISKPPERAALGTRALTAAARHGVPILAQGGVTAGRVRECLSAGAAGVAVTGEILLATDPAAAAAALRRALDA